MAFAATSSDCLQANVERIFLFRQKLIASGPDYVCSEKRPKLYKLRKNLLNENTLFPSSHRKAFVSYTKNNLL